MPQALTLPHRCMDGMCPVNGIRDLIQWRTGLNWSNEFLWGLGQGGGFAYLRFNSANPPRQMFTGNATPRQHRYLAELLGASFSENEGRSYKTAWKKAQEALDAGNPPILGPLDMFHLHYYSSLYQHQHVPIHFVLLVGYDDTNAFILDTGFPETQAIPLDELRLAWDVNTPGVGRRNRVAVLEIPQGLASVDAIVRKAIADQCQTMLRPLVSMLGIPAMLKLADEIVHWPKELGEQTARECLHQVREYLNSPPDAQGDHLTAGRDHYTAFLHEAGGFTGLDFATPIEYLSQSMAIIPGLARAISRGELDAASQCFRQMAAFETQAFQELSIILKK